MVNNHDSRINIVVATQVIFLVRHFYDFSLYFSILFQNTVCNPQGESDTVSMMSERTRLAQQEVYFGDRGKIKFRGMFCTTCMYVNTTSLCGL